MSWDRNCVLECFELAKKQRISSSDVPSLYKVWPFSSCFQFSNPEPPHLLPLGSTPLNVFFDFLFFFSLTSFFFFLGLFLLIFESLVIFLCFFLMLIKDILKIIIIFPSQYILILLNDINRLNSFFYLLFLHLF